MKHSDFDRQPSWTDEIRAMERKHSPHKHLRDVWIKDEYDAADWVWKMQSISPVFGDFFADQQMRNAMGVLDQETYDGLTRAFPGVGMMKEIGVMPEGMLMLLWAQDPDFLHDRERLYKFLNARPEYRKGEAQLDPNWEPSIGV